jgi:glucose/arabinose dehydrogenase
MDASRFRPRVRVLAGALAGLLFCLGGIAAAQPTMVDEDLTVIPAATGLTTPIAMAILDQHDWFVIEKNTGRVQLVTDGVLKGPVLDLAVNFSSERGLLGIALHPSFPDRPYVYLFWSCAAPPPPADNPFFPTTTRCSGNPELGADTDDILAVPLLGNRVDRFVWDGSHLSFDSNLIMLRSFQNDALLSPTGPNGEIQPPRGNHNGGVLRFGHDGKLYVMFGDVGRRGQLQNLRSGPTQDGEGPVTNDDQHTSGGPEPDDAHFTGVILRLNDDGTTPADNPFADFVAERHAPDPSSALIDDDRIPTEVETNVRKIFAYGVRNSFGMAVDPLTGNLWDQENGEDAFDEINLVEPGMNSGWIQIMGPISRLAQYKEIETTSLHAETFPNLQQFRWGPERIADSAAEAFSRLFKLPNSHYSDPEYSWKYVLAPAGIGFLNGHGLGREYFGRLFVGFSVNDDPLGGGLMAFPLTDDRRRIAGNSIADNATFNDPSQNAEHIIGRDFGILTDIQTSPRGTLLVVSLDQGTVYEILRRPKPVGDGGRPFSVVLSGAEEAPGPGDPDGSGRASLRINPGQQRICFQIRVSDITLPATAAHIHEAPVGQPGPVVVGLTPPNANGASEGCVTAKQEIIVAILENPANYYVNVHTSDFPAGAVRGQLAGGK